MPIDRRRFLGLSLAGAAGTRVNAPWLIHGAPSPATPATFPRQDQDSVDEIVLVAHFDLARVKKLVEARPALAKAAIDWGFGDWEDALGAASHTGRLDIAEVLLAHGARPTIYSAAMMGQLDTVKAFVSAEPGCQRILGPHGLTLQHHARAGGARAAATLAFLQELGDADVSPTRLPMDEKGRAMYVGAFAFGDAPEDVLQVTADATGGGLSIKGPGIKFAHRINYLGNDEFSPTGAESVRIRFGVVGESATSLSVVDAGVVVTATRQQTR